LAPPSTAVRRGEWRLEGRHAGGTCAPETPASRRPRLPHPRQMAGRPSPCFPSSLDAVGQSCCGRTPP
jgi:hypothetical protein